MMKIEKIIPIVADEYHISEKAIFSKSRLREVAEARQMVYYILREDYNSFVNIARLMNRTHSNVIYGCNNIRSLLRFDKTVKQKYDRIMNKLCNQD